jgi:enamine deaminase RidA (YjgF/YER057c/UK114 family)
VVAGGFVHVAGQLPIAADGRKLSDAPFEDQARQVLANVEAALVGAGSRPDQLVQVRVYLTDIAHWPAFNSAVRRLAGPAPPGARGGAGAGAALRLPDRGRSRGPVPAIRSALTPWEAP